MRKIITLADLAVGKAAGRNAPNETTFSGSASGEGGIQGLGRDLPTT